MGSGTRHGHRDPGMRIRITGWALGSRDEIRILGWASGSRDEDQNPGMGIRIAGWNQNAGMGIGFSGSESRDEGMEITG